MAALPDIPSRMYLPCRYLSRSPSRTGHLEGVHYSGFPLRNLPPELLLQILHFLEPSDLRSLATTCRHLHYLALEVCLRYYNVPNPADEIVVESSNIALLQTLHLATFIQRPKCFIWRAENTDTWVTEVKNVRRFLAKIEHIGTITLDFSRAVNFGRTREDAKMVNARMIRPWLNIITGVLDAAARKCATLLVLNQSATLEMSGPRIDARHLVSDRKPSDFQVTEDWTRCPRFSIEPNENRPSLFGQLQEIYQRARPPYRISRLEIFDPSLLQNRAFLVCLKRWIKRLPLETVMHVDMNEP